MPVVIIRYSAEKLKQKTLAIMGLHFPFVIADALTCPEGGELAPEDIMLEFTKCTVFDKNVKDLNIRVLAQDYPTRKERLSEIRNTIKDELLRCVETNISWYLWVFLAETSYCSDTDEG